MYSAKIKIRDDYMVIELPEIDGNYIEIRCFEKRFDVYDVNDGMPPILIGSFTNIKDAIKFIYSVI